MSVLTCLTFYIWCTALSVLHSSPQSAYCLTKMQLWVFAFGVYKSAYWMTDLFVIYANNALMNQVITAFPDVSEKGEIYKEMLDSEF